MHAYPHVILLGIITIIYSAAFYRGFQPRTFRFSCPNSQAYLNECTFDTHIHNWCPTSSQIYLTCGEPQFEIPIRLSGGTALNNGRVEIFASGQWGTVCSSQQYGTRRIASTVCRMLGYQSAIVRADRVNPYGQGTGIIWLQPSCDGNETSVLQCQSFGLGVPLCSHRDDIGIDCLGETLSFLIARVWIRGGWPPVFWIL